MTAARSPTPRFHVQGESVPYLTRDAAVIAAVEASKLVPGYEVRVDLVDGIERRPLGLAKGGGWRWATWDAKRGWRVP